MKGENIGVFDLLVNPQLVIPFIFLIFPLAESNVDFVLKTDSNLICPIKIDSPLGWQRLLRPSL